MDCPDRHEYIGAAGDPEGAQLKGDWTTIKSAPRGLLVPEGMLVNMTLGTDGGRTATINDPGMTHNTTPA
jgi:hypothetical protein